MSVGDYTKRDGSTLTLAEAWTGGRWHLLPTPTPGNSYDSLEAVSCPSRRWCMAVGDHQGAHFIGYALAEIWNGRHWRVSPIRQPAGSFDTTLLAVSCTSPDSCLAAGSTADGHGLARVLTERWNGTRWRILDTAQPVKSSGIAFIAGVSCPSSRTCTAVGYYNVRDDKALPLAELWNGATWRIQRLPIPARARDAILSAVSCSSPTACTAVGEAASRTTATLAERWNGKKWSLQSIPNPPHPASPDAAVSLNAISCPSSGACVTVVSWLGADLPAFAESWNGSKWTMRLMPEPSKATASILDGLSCTVTKCTATGSFDTKADQIAPWTAVERR